MRKKLPKLGPLPAEFPLTREEFSTASIDYGGAGSAQLDPVWIRASNDEKDFSGELVSGVRYRDYYDNWYRCVYRFERNVSIRGSCPFTVTTLRQESC